MVIMPSFFPFLANECAPIDKNNEKIEFPLRKKKNIFFRIVTLPRKMFNSWYFISFADITLKYIVARQLIEKSNRKNTLADGMNDSN